MQVDGELEVEDLEISETPAHHHRADDAALIATVTPHQGVRWTPMFRLDHEGDVATPDP